MADEKIVEEPVEGEYTKDSVEGEGPKEPGEGKKKKEQSLFIQAFKATMKETGGQIKSVFKRDKSKPKEPKKKTDFKEKIKDKKEKIFKKDQVRNIYHVEKKISIETEKPLLVSELKTKVSKIKKRVPLEIVNRNDRISFLKKEIYRDLKSKPISEVIPKSLELAILLDRENEVGWMFRELFGYFGISGKKNNIFVDKKRVPEYRKIDANLELILRTGNEPPMKDELLVPFFCIRSIGWIENEVAKYSKENLKEVKMTSFLPEELSMIKKYLGSQPVFLRMNTSHLQRIITEVKFRVGTFISTL